MRTGFLITARLKSTRLPYKLLLKIFDREIIKWMIDRLKLCPELNQIIICTSHNNQDDPLEIIANQENVGIYRGSEEDVLQRLYDAAIYFNLDYIVNVTADCPLVSYEYVATIINEYKKSNADLIRCLDLPHGFFSYGIKIDALKRVCDIKDSKNTEVWGKYFTDTGLFRVIDLNIPKDLQRHDFRITLDYIEDFNLIKAIFDNFGESTFSKSIAEIINFLDNHPEIVEINKNCKEAFQKNFETQNVISIKGE